MQKAVKCHDDTSAATAIDLHLQEVEKHQVGHAIQAKDVNGEGSLVWP